MNRLENEAVNSEEFHFQEHELTAERRKHCSWVLNIFHNGLTCRRRQRAQHTN